MATPVVVDTNGWLLPFTDGTDLEAEADRLIGAHQWILPQSVAAELERLARGSGDAARNARAAQRLATRARAEATELAGDDGVLDVARRLQAAVVTNDQRLAAECRRSGLVVLRSRGHGRLMRDDE